ncbi:MAG: hypothetical protein C0425_11715 [Chlorobiaceae bacterium]|nr:hypothetical protein [Chlorobiaceae bacterium]MBA4310981.1 hypothetical protein [Chlorobiaceae bacterium]
MKNIAYGLIFFLLVTVNNTLAWGEEGHKIINKKGMELLPKEMKSFLAWETFIVDNASEPDIRRDSDPAEFFRHFIDVDFYSEFNEGRMNQNKEELIAKYSDSVVTKMGIIPWTILETYNNLVTALKEKNSNRAKALIADLGHYVADCYNPMHTVLNYDGQLTNQKGLHSRYESRMLRRNLEELERRIKVTPAVKIDNVLDYTFDFITASNSYNYILFNADLHALKYSNNEYNDEYYRLLWFKTKYLTANLFGDAATSFASLFYSAWTDAGKPEFEKFN